MIDYSGKILARERQLTPKATEALYLWEFLVGMCERIFEPNVYALGVGCGGPMGTAGDTVSPLNIPAWRDFPLRGRLAEIFGRPVFVDNDAKALALGEHRFGAARGVDNFLAMVVSTGIGGGIFLDGRLLVGRHSNAGHVGHLRVVDDGVACECGSYGCLEAEVSGSAIQRQFGVHPKELPREDRRRVGMLVGRGVAMVANLLDLDRAFIGGSVALGYGDDFFRSARLEGSKVARLEFSRSLRARL